MKGVSVISNDNAAALHVVWSDVGAPYLIWDRWHLLVFYLKYFLNRSFVGTGKGDTIIVRRRTNFYIRDVRYKRTLLPRSEKQTPSDGWSADPVQP